MIPLTTTVCQDVYEDKHQRPIEKPAFWQNELARAYRSPIKLLETLELAPEDLPYDISTQSDFPLRVPRGYAAKIKPGDPYDPLLLQVLNQQQEEISPSGYQHDPVGDNSAVVEQGLLHKYRGRVLIIATSACPIHCRYCFRRHFPYSESRPENGNWSQVISYIEADASIHEVILSGGDPLSLSNEKLQLLSDRLAEIPHIKRLRLHSRMPIVLPERIDSGFTNWLKQLPWQTVLVTHSNHANEIDKQVAETLMNLRSTGTTLLNQAVLLKGINDNSPALINLSETLFKADTLPYYLHLLDRVTGAAHFEVKESKAVGLMRDLQRALPGYLVPKLVREVAGEPHKVLINRAV